MWSCNGSKATIGCANIPQPQIQFECGRNTTLSIVYLDIVAFEIIASL